MRRFLFRAVRFLALIHILFISLFAFDAFSGDHRFLEELGGFLLHLTPSFLLAALLVISWRHVLAGAAGYVMFSIAAAFFIHGPSAGAGFYLIAGIPFIWAILFSLEFLFTKDRRQAR